MKTLYTLLVLALATSFSANAFVSQKVDKAGLTYQITDVSDFAYRGCGSNTALLYAYNEGKELLVCFDVENNMVSYNFGKAKNDKPDMVVKNNVDRIDYSNVQNMMESANFSNKDVTYRVQLTTDKETTSSGYQTLGKTQVDVIVISNKTNKQIAKVNLGNEVVYNQMYLIENKHLIK